MSSARPSAATISVALGSKVAMRMHVVFAAGAGKPSAALESFPSEFLEVDPSRAAEPHALAAEERPLQDVPAAGPPADLALHVDDAMPGHIVRADAERPADCARPPRYSERAGDRAVGGDPAAWNPADETVHAGEKGGPDRRPRRRAAPHRPPPTSPFILSGTRPRCTSPPAHYPEPGGCPLTGALLYGRNPPRAEPTSGPLGTLRCRCSVAR